MGVFVIIPSDSDLMHHGVKGQKWGVRRYQNKDGSLTELGKRRLGTDGPTYGSKKASPTTALTVFKGRSSRSGSRSYDRDDSTVEGDPKGYKSSKRKRKDFVEGTWKEVNDKEPENRKSENGKSKKNTNQDQASKAIQDSFSTVNKITKTLIEREQKNLKEDKKRAAKNLDVSKMSDDDLKKAINRMSLENKYRELKSERIGYGRERTIERLKMIGEIVATGGTIVGIVTAIKKAKG